MLRDRLCRTKELPVLQPLVFEKTGDFLCGFPHASLKPDFNPTVQRVSDIRSCICFHHGMIGAGPANSEDDVFQKVDELSFL